MKKSMKVLLLTLGIAGLSVNMNVANAGHFAKVKGNDICQVLSYLGHSSKFWSDDQAMDALLNYDETSGDGVSGGFGAIDEGQHYSAPVIDSHCNDGVVTLTWNQNDFTGSVTGTIDVPGNKIANVTGTINGKEVHNDLKFRYYQ